ncbi:uncharacterized protein [Eurosta solidaginis]|uniref:uncharacterized protein n=1 Tax=Eurosta solidaginis TaxID=178769 RepID=UPI003530AB70
MQEIDGRITINDLKKKWKGLRTQYLQECRSVQNSQKSGAGLDDIYRPRLWCFDQLKFLQSHVKLRKSVNSVNTKHASDAPSPRISEKGAKKTKLSADIAIDIKKMKEMIADRKEKKNKFEWLARQVTEQMEEVDEEYQPQAVMEVQGVINKYWQETIMKKNSLTSTDPVYFEEVAMNAISLPPSPSPIPYRNILEESMVGIFSDEEFESL